MRTSILLRVTLGRVGHLRRSMSYARTLPPRFKQSNLRSAIPAGNHRHTHWAKACVRQSVL